MLGVSVRYATRCEPLANLTAIESGRDASSAASFLIVNEGVLWAY
jgi:hypothetical protein